MATYFDENLINKARQLLANSEQFIDEANDIKIIEDAINSFSNKQLATQWLVNLDQQMRKKYIEINTISALAKNIQWIMPPTKVRMYQPQILEIERLKEDGFCILARVLKTAKEIGNFFEVFDKKHIAS